MGCDRSRPQRRAQGEQRGQSWWRFVASLRNDVRFEVLMPGQCPAVVGGVGGSDLCCVTGSWARGEGRGFRFLMHPATPALGLGSTQGAVLQPIRPATPISPKAFLLAQPRALPRSAGSPRHGAVVGGQAPAEGPRRHGLPHRAVGPLEADRPGGAGKWGTGSLPAFPPNPPSAHAPAPSAPPPSSSSS